MKTKKDKTNLIEQLKTHIISLREKDVAELILKREASERDRARRKTLIDGLERDNAGFFKDVSGIEKAAAIKIYEKIIKGEDATNLMSKISNPALILYFYFDAHASRNNLKEHVGQINKAIKEVKKTITGIKEGKHDKEYAKLIEERGEEIASEVRGDTGDGEEDVKTS